MHQESHTQHNFEAVTAVWCMSTICGQRVHIIRSNSDPLIIKVQHKPPGIKPKQERLQPRAAPWNECLHERRLLLFEHTVTHTHTVTVISTQFSQPKQVHTGPTQQVKEPTTKLWRSHTNWTTTTLTEMHENKSSSRKIFPDLQQNHAHRSQQKPTFVLLLFSFLQQYTIHQMSNPTTSMWRVTSQRQRFPLDALADTTRGYEGKITHFHHDV